MPIVVACNVKLPVAELNLALEQRMHYRITAIGEVMYKMRDHELTPMLSGSGAGVAHRAWPMSPTDVPKKNIFVHGIGIRIFGIGSLRWEVEVQDVEGVVLTIVKDCTYTNDIGTATRLDLVEIVIVNDEMVTI